MSELIKLFPWNDSTGVEFLIFQGNENINANHYYNINDDKWHFTMGEMFPQHGPFDTKEQLLEEIEQHCLYLSEK